MSNTAVITLSPPQDYDLRSLAETTRQSLQLLKPWTLLKPNPNDPLVGQITTQAAKYVSAIQMGVSAAYSGFTVTEEVLFLAHALPIEDEEDLRRYLVGMMELAKEARENASKAYTAFRNVRGEIFATMEKMKQLEEEAARAGADSKTNPRKDLPQYGSKDLDTLMKFAEHISKFANWWDWVKVETDPSHSDLPLSLQLDTLNDPEVVKRWERIRTQYTAYVQMIGEIEDSDPQFFNRTWAATQLEESKDTSSRTERSGSQSTSASAAQTETSPKVPPKGQPQVTPTAPSEKAITKNSIHTAPEKPSGIKQNSDKKRKDTSFPANSNGDKSANLTTRFRTKFRESFPTVARRVFKGLKERVHSVSNLWHFTKAAQRPSQSSLSSSESDPSRPMVQPNILGKHMVDEPSTVSGALGGFEVRS